MRGSQAVLSVVALLMFCPAAFAATSYVAVTGSDAASGSSTFPWATLQHAVDSIAAGDTIVVRSGTYAGCRIGSPGQAVASFPDVPPTQWAFRYVEYAKLLHVVTGYADGSYGPAIAVDRGQMAAYVARDRQPYRRGRLTAEALA